MNGSTVLSRFTFTVPTFRIQPITMRTVIVRGVLPAVAGALLLAGCGSSGSSSSSTASAAAAGATSSSSTSAFTTCLKQHGVKVTPGQFGGSGRPTARPTGSFSPRAFPSGSARPSGSFGGANSAAFKACAKYAPAGFAAGRGRAAISSSALAAFKSCMSSKGVKVTGTTAGQVMSQLRNSTGTTATAFKTCQVLLQPAAPTPTASS